MHIEHLDEFRLLIEIGSFKQASQQAYISQSVLSKHMASLEKHFGVELFDKSRQGVNLTECGNRAYEGAKQVLAAYSRMLNAIDEARGNADGRLVIGYLRDSAQPILLRLIGWFEAYHPELELKLISLRYENLARALRDGSIDVAIAMNDNTDLANDCSVLPIYDDRLAVALPLTHPLAQKESVKIEEIADEHLLIPSEDIWPSMNLRIRRFLDFSERTSIEYMSDVDTLFLLLESGRGVAIVASHNRYAYGNRVWFADLEEENNAHFPVSALWLKSTEDKPTKANALAYLKAGLQTARNGLNPKDIENLRVKF